MPRDRSAIAPSDRVYNPPVVTDLGTLAGVTNQDPGAGLHFAAAAVGSVGSPTPTPEPSASPSPEPSASPSPEPSASPSPEPSASPSPSPEPSASPSPSPTPGAVTPTPSPGGGVLDEVDSGNNGNNGQN